MIDPLTTSDPIYIAFSNALALAPTSELLRLATDPDRVLQRVKDFEAQDIRRTRRYDELVPALEKLVDAIIDGRVPAERMPPGKALAKASRLADERVDTGAILQQVINETSARRDAKPAYRMSIEGQRELAKPDCQRFTCAINERCSYPTACGVVAGYGPLPEPAKPDQFTSLEPTPLERLASIACALEEIEEKFCKVGEHFAETKTEKAWLIVDTRSLIPQYWEKYTGCGQVHWTDDPNEACRFAREVDAAATIKATWDDHPLLTHVIAREHMFLNAIDQVPA